MPRMDRPRYSRRPLNAVLAAPACHCRRISQSLCSVAVLAVGVTLFTTFLSAAAAVVAEPDPSAEPQLVVEQRCEGNRSFNIAMDYTWRPGYSLKVEEKGPGFGALLCVAHGPEFSLWSVGKPNSPSLTKLLQTQNFSFILKEIRNNQTAKHVSTYNMSSTGVVKSPGRDVVNVTVSPEINATLISCIAALTPTPDWFIGISDLEMCEVNETTGTYSYPAKPKVINLYTYDAEFNDQETPLGESIPVARSRPVRRSVGMGLLGTAEIAIPRQYVAPSQTAVGESTRRRHVECFPGSATVERDDGRRVLMRHLSASQRIHTGRNAYSEVFMFSHRDPHVWAEFVTLHFVDRTTNRSGALTATRGHYVYVHDNNAAPILTGMDTVRKGDCLLSRDRSPLRVVHITSTWEQGLYNPHTVDGDLVVDGARVSSFTRAVDPKAAIKVIRPLRVLYEYRWKRTVHFLTTIALSGRFNLMLARLLPSGI